MAIQWIIKSRACARALLFTGLLRYARNDKKVVCAGAQEFYDLGPVVKPRDDKFLRFFILRFFSIVIPAQAGIHCTAGICVANATHYLNFEHKKRGDAPFF